METTKQKTTRTSPRTGSTVGAPGAPRRAATRRTPAGEARAESSLAHEVIARRAYDLFEHSGQVHGRDVEFWLTAEQELKKSYKL